ncbi:MAG: deaminase, partial [Sphingobacterium sp.]
MKPIALSRKEFIRNSALALAGATLIPGMLLAEDGGQLPHQHILDGHQGKKSYILKNVLLETGFEYDGNGNVIATKTGLFSIQIEAGKIKKIGPNSTATNAIDAKGRLMLPSFRDMHIHLDKTFYGDKWQAVRRGAGGVKGMIALEQQILPELLKNSTY